MSDGHQFLRITVSNHSLLGKNLPITNPTIRTERLKPEDPSNKTIFTRLVMKDYYKQKVFKDKATLTLREKEFQKSTSGITSKGFLNTFTPKMDALDIKTRRIKKWWQPILEKSMYEDRIFLQKHRLSEILLNSGNVS